MILEGVPSGPYETNAYLVGCPVTRKCAVVDPSPGSASRLRTLIAQYNLTLDRVLLTHSHWDHIADAHCFDAPLYVHRLDAPNIENPGTDRLRSLVKIPAVKPAGYVSDGERFTIGNLQVAVIHTPGHSPGAVCYYFPEEGVLLSGDTLFAGAYGILSLPTGEPAKMRASLQKLGRLPPETRVYPGHGEATTIGQERKLLE